MTEYTTASGYYVLLDSEGRVFAKADMGGAEGTYSVSDRADPSQCYDVESADDLNAIDRDPHYDDPSNW